MNKNLDSKVETITRNGGTVGYETITPALATEYLNAMPGGDPLPGGALRPQTITPTAWTL